MGDKFTIEDIAEAHKDGYRLGRDELPTTREVIDILEDLIAELRTPDSWEWHTTGPCTCDVVPCAALMAAERAEARLSESNGVAK